MPSERRKVLHDASRFACERSRERMFPVLALPAAVGFRGEMPVYSRSNPSVVAYSRAGTCNAPGVNHQA